MVSVLADSSLQKNHKPFFVPDWSGAIDCGVELVVRICRLGKAIPERFAHRYYDAITVGVGFTDREMERSMAAGALSGGLCRSFDGASVIGDWVDRIVSATSMPLTSALTPTARPSSRAIPAICCTPLTALWPTSAASAP